jgi:hypothetical protein
MDETRRGPRQDLQRSAADSVTSTIPPIVHEALRSPGQPLDGATRALMESRLGPAGPGVGTPSGPTSVQPSLTVSQPGDPAERQADRAADRALASGRGEARFGHDFSRVRVHTDATAAEAARAVHALAFTAGEHIVFASGQYAPAGTGKRLLAHELAHVVQQAGALSTTPASGSLIGNSSSQSGPPPTLQRMVGPPGRPTPQGIAVELHRALLLAGSSMPFEVITVMNQHRLWDLPRLALAVADEYERIIGVSILQDIVKLVAPDFQEWIMHPFLGTELPGDFPTPPEDRAPV